MPFSSKSHTTKISISTDFPDWKIRNINIIHKYGTRTEPYGTSVSTRLPVDLWRLLITNLCVGFKRRVITWDLPYQRTKKRVFNLFNNSCMICTRSVIQRGGDRFMWNHIDNLRNIYWVLKKDSIYCKSYFSKLVK